MDIIIDTREQKPLKFTGHKTITRKLDEGDYNTPELEEYIVIERKSLPDLYQSITSDHARFKKEILRAKAKDKRFYIFLEGTLEEFYSLSWSDRTLKQKPETLRKIIETMTKRYDITFFQNSDREKLSEKILLLIEHKTLFYGHKWNKKTSEV